MPFTVEEFEKKVAGALQESGLPERERSQSDRPAGLPLDVPDTSFTRKLVEMGVTIGAGEDLRSPVEETISALKAGGVSAMESFSGFGEMLHIPGAAEARKWWGELGESEALRRPEYLQEETVWEHPERLVDWRWWVRSLGENAPNMAAMMLPGVGAWKGAKLLKFGETAIRRAAMTGAWAGAAGIEAGAAYNQAKEEMTAQGYDETETERVATLEGITVGVVNGILEILPFDRLFLRNNKAFGIGQRIFRQALIEGKTETAQEAWSIQVEKWGHKPDQRLRDNIGRMLESAIIGFTLGGFAGAGEAMVRPSEQPDTGMTDNAHMATDIGSGPARESVQEEEHLKDVRKRAEKLLSDIELEVAEEEKDERPIPPAAEPAAREVMAEPAAKTAVIPQIPPETLATELPPEPEVSPPEALAQTVEAETGKTPTESIQEVHIKTEELANAIKKVQPSSITVGKGIFEKEMIAGDLLYKEKDKETRYSANQLAAAILDTEQADAILLKAIETPPVITPEAPPERVEPRPQKITGTKAETGPANFDEMVDAARKWKGAALKADAIYEAVGDRKSRLEHSHITTKGDMDAYLIRKFGVDEATARNVSNELTAKNLTPDMNIDLEEFRGEAWADAALEYKPAQGQKAPEKVTPAAEPKEPWEMTSEEYTKSLGMDTRFLPPPPKRMGARLVRLPDGTIWNTSEHGEAVFKALTEGKTVPDEVMAEYPELTAGKVEEKSKGHALFTDKYEYFYGLNGDLYRAPIDNTLDQNGYRQGARFESTKAAAEDILNRVKEGTTKAETGEEGTYKTIGGAQYADPEMVLSKKKTGTGNYEIGDVYFNPHPDRNFKEYDKYVIVAGPEIDGKIPTYSMTKKGMPEIGLPPESFVPELTPKGELQVIKEGTAPKQLTSEAKAKEPWEMTNKEWKNYLRDKEENIEGFIDDDLYSLIAQFLRDKGIKQLTKDNAHVLEEYLNDNKFRLTTPEHKKKIVNAIIEADEIHSQRYRHKEAVEKALTEGKPVPDEVMAEFPELEIDSLVSELAEVGERYDNNENVLVDVLGTEKFSFKTRMIVNEIRFLLDEHPALINKVPAELAGFFESYPDIQEKIKAGTEKGTGKKISARKPAGKTPVSEEFKVGDVLDPQGNTNMVGTVTIRAIEGNTLKFTDEAGTEYSGMQRSLVRDLIKGGSWKKISARKPASSKKEAKGGFRLQKVYDTEGETERDITELGSMAPERKFRNDLRRFATGLMDALGWEPHRDKKGKNISSEVNVAPVGGDGHIVLWKPDSAYGIYIDFSVDRVDGDNLEVSDDIMYRATTKDNVWKGLSNNWTKGDVTVDDMARLAEKEVTFHEGAHAAAKKRAPEKLTPEQLRVRAEAESIVGKLPVGPTRDALARLINDAKLGNDPQKALRFDAKGFAEYLARAKEELHAGVSPEPAIVDVIESPGLRWETFVKGLSEQERKLVEPFIPTDHAPRDVDAQIAFIKKELGKETEKAAVKKEPAESDNPSYVLSGQIAGRLAEGTAISSKDLFALADEAFGGTTAQGTYTPKDAYDAMELGINRFIRDHPEYYNPMGEDAETAQIPEYAIKGLKERINALIPTQTRRTKEMDAKQQFSTVPPLAYAANWVANLRPDDVYVEPEAGIGGLAVFAKTVPVRRIILNELSERRAGLLRLLLPDAEIFQENAAQLNNILPVDIRPTVVVMNPPFSASATMIGKKVSMEAATHIEQALKRLEPDGRLVAITGRGMSMGAPQFRNWWKKIKAEYAVRANIGVSGKEYTKYGTSFDNRLIVIDKTAPNPKDIVEGDVEKVEDLIPLLKEVRDDRVTPRKQTEGKPDGKETAPAGEGGGRPGTTVLPAAGTVGTKQGEGEGPERPAGSTPGKSAPVETEGGHEISDREPGGGRAQPAGGPGEEPGGGGTGGGGAGVAPHEPGGEGGRVPAGKGMEIGAAEKKTKTAFSEGLYEQYRPEKLTIKNAKIHPTPLVQSAAMDAVEPVEPTYTPSLPESVIKEGRLSDVQLEAIIYAGQSHEQVLPDGTRRGYFIGDGTGVGKGREIAGVMRDNWEKGRKRAVWISGTASLVKDAKRDISDSGWNPELVKDLSKTKATGAISLKEGILFTTYSTLRSRPKKQGLKSRLDQITDWLGEDFDGVIAFDESHNMGNAVEVKIDRGRKKPSASALAGIELQRRLPKARVLYVSATGATEVVNLAYAERLGLWGEGTPFASKESFINEISSGGIAAMEMVAMNMKSMGVYMARSLSYDGVTYDNLEHALTPQQVSIYNKLAEAWQIVLHNIDTALEVTGVTTTTRSGQQRTLDKDAKGRAHSAFWGQQQRFFNQVMTAMQMPTALKHMHKSLDEGASVVISLVNTLEATQERAITKLGEDQTLEDLDMSPKDILMQLIEHSFPTAQFEEYLDEDNNTRSRPVVDSHGNAVQNPEAVAMRERLLDELGSIREMAIANPLDMIINEFGTEATAEVTGRKRRVVETDEGRVLEKRSDAACRADVEEFNNDKKRILVFSGKGDTGASYHPDRRFKNQRERVFYIVQPGWRADKVMQAMGRVHRSNQKQPPRYVLCTTNLKGQKRFVSSIARRLDQLGALTKGQRQTGSQGIFQARDNLENQYARDGLSLFFEDLHRGNIPDLSTAEFEEQTALRLTNDQGSLLKNLPDMKHFLNHILSLKVDMMDRVFDAFNERQNRMIDRAIEEGTLDQGMETVKAKRIDKVRQETVYTDKSGAETRYVELAAEQPARIMPWEDAASRFTGFYRNRKSGKIWGATVRQETDNLTGQIVDVAAIISPNYGYQKLIGKEFSEEKWEKLTKTAAETLWKEALAALPSTYTETIHMITGNILPVWDRLPRKHTRIVRAQTTDGERLIGRIILQKDIDETLKRLGAGERTIEFNTDEAYSKVLDEGYRITLVNDWEIKRARVAGEERIEIEGPYYDDTDILERHGVFSERISYTTRYFVPTTDAGKETLAYIITEHPVNKIIPPSRKSPGGGHLFESYSTKPGTAAVSPPSIEDVRRVFKGQEVEEIEGGHFGVRLANGTRVDIRTVDAINEDRVSFACGYGREKKAGEEVAGVYREGRIELRRGLAGRWTLAHESYHLMEDMGLISPAEVQTLKQKIKALHREGAFEPVDAEHVGFAEDRANYVADQLEGLYNVKSVTGRIIQKIRGFLDRLLGAFGIHTAGGTVRKIATGRVFEEPVITEKAPAAFGQQFYSVVREPHKQSREDWEKNRTFANKLFSMGNLARHRIGVEVQGLQRRVQELAGPASRKKMYVGFGYQKTLKRSMVSDDLDRAMMLYRDIGGDMEKIQRFRERAQELIDGREIDNDHRLYLTKTLRVLDVAENLTDEQKAFVEDMAGLFESAYETARAHKIVQTHRDNYVRRIYSKIAGDERGAIQGTGAGHSFKVWSTASKERKYDTILDAVLDGYQLGVEGITNSYLAYMEEIATIIANKAFIQAGVNIKDTTGGSLFTTEKKPGYAPLEARGFSVWRWAGKAEIESEFRDDEALVVNTFGRRFFATIPERIPESFSVYKDDEAQRPSKSFETEEEAIAWAAEKGYERIERNIPRDVSQMFEKQQLYAPEALADPINRMTKTEDFFSTTPALQELLRFNAGVKSWILMSSFFHHLAGSRSWVFGVHHGLKELNPVKAYKLGLKKIEDLDPLIDLGVRNGLTLGEMQDWSEFALRKSRGLTERLVRHFGLEKAAGIIEKGKFHRETWADSLFKRYFAGLKAEAFCLEYTHELQKATDEYHAGKRKEQPRPDAIAEQVATWINADLGGLHLKRMGRNPTFQNFFRLVTLAPDWTESNFRTVTGMIPGLNKIIDTWSGGIPEPPGMEKVYRRFWGRVILRIAVATIIAQMLLNGKDESEEFYAEQLLSNQRTRKKLRWTEMDITRLYHMLGIDTEGQRKTFSLGGHFFDPLKLIDPPRLIKAKGSPFMRVAEAFGSKSDWAERPFTGAGELVRTGKTVKESHYEEKEGFVNSLPSLIVNQVRNMQPIQVGHFLSYLQGEEDGLTALMHSAGAATHTAWKPMVDTPIVKAKEGDDPVYEAIKDLQDADVLNMAPPSRSMVINNVSRRLSADLYESYLEDSSMIVRRKLEGTVTSRAWERYTDARKARLVGSVIRNARKRVRARIKRLMVREMREKLMAGS